jgi:hypothetical protein
LPTLALNSPNSLSSLSKTPACRSIAEAILAISAVGGAVARAVERGGAV